MQNTSIKIGVRQSQLAQAMAHEVKNALLNIYKKNLNQKPLLKEKENIAANIQCKTFITKGDKIQDRQLLELGGKGLFTAEIEEALHQNHIDIAVHSAKDMPSFLPDGLKIAGYLKREDLRDGFISRSGKRFFDLPKNAVIGTASLRRQALIHNLRPDLKITLLRGNVGTRLKKVEQGEVDGTFLAMAGLKRLGLQDKVQEIFDADFFPPAPGQGAICIEIRTPDTKIAKFLEPILDQQTGIEVTCERAFLKEIDGSCRTPLACYACLKNQQLFGFAQIFSFDGQKIYEAKKTAPPEKAKQLGIELAKELKNLAGTEFFDQWHK